MRGKALYGVFEGLVGGITPAHAGKSFGLVIKFLRHGDHPRTCGEKGYNGVDMRTSAGSPPHMRGKERMGFQIVHRPWITPAHAGKSSRIVNANTFGAGSPPHMRGKVDIFGQAVECIWITPAHAGKRIFFTRTSGAVWDHPRTCGEKTKKIP